MQISKDNFIEEGWLWNVIDPNDEHKRMESSWNCFWLPNRQNNTFFVKYSFSYISIYIGISYYFWGTFSPCMDWTIYLSKLLWWYLRDTYLGLCYCKIWLWFHDKKCLFFARLVSLITCDPISLSLAGRWLCALQSEFLIKAWGSTPREWPLRAMYRIPDYYY